MISKELYEQRKELEVSRRYKGDLWAQTLQPRDEKGNVNPDFVRVYGEEGLEKANEYLNER